jgi:hypothetical protein
MNTNFGALGLSQKQSLQILVGQQRRVLRPFQKGTDIVADGLHVQCSQPFPHQLFPGWLVVTAGPLSLV